MLKNKKFQTNKLFISFVTMLFLATTLLLAQEQKFNLTIQSNPTDLDYWWLEKNNFGIESNNFHFQTNWELNTLNTQYIINTFSQKEGTNIYFSESFIKHNFSEETFLKVGKYYRDFSNYLNDELSSGSMLISHNAEPMPKIGLVMSKKFNKVSFDFGIAHGIFDDNNEFYKQSPLLHEKFLYLNRIKNNYKISFGIVHEAMWAGELPEQLGGEQPNTLKDFFKIFLASDGEKREGDSHANALGNHLGIWDFSFEKIDDEKILKFYYQHLFEDTSSLRLRNEIDGLWGIEFINYIPDTNIVFEYLDTTHCCIDPPYQNDRYYWNGQYGGGWSYKNYTLGNPFINHLEHELIKVFHSGVSIRKSSSYYQIKMSRKIHIDDTIKYKITIGNTIKERINSNLFIVGNNNKSGIGINLNIIF